MALPREHGGWGLTLEPCLLGLLVAWSASGLFLALAAGMSFLARTPLRIALVDLHRSRTLERTKLAHRLFAVELALLIALAAAAVALSHGQFWVPALVAAPMVLTAFWFEMRSRGRRLLPELAGSVGICSVATMTVLAAGGSAGLAIGCWLVLGARAVTSIPHVRSMIARLHGRHQAPVICAVSDSAALALVVVATLVCHPLVAGGVAVVAVILAQRLTARSTTARPVIIGIRQTLMGLAVVAASAVGVLVMTK
ncbi:MAG: YwiC-like family protein [Acidimicrobiales bacterium]